MDLDCLKSIPTLVDLELSSGTFTHVHLTSHLAGLTITRANVEVDAIDAPCGLQQLCIDRSDIYSLPGGICVLTSLRRLWCSHSVVHTPQAACKLSTGPQVDLHGLSALTQLELLALCTKRPAYPSLEPVYTLQSLNDLNLVAAGSSSIDVTEGLSKLSILTRLVIEPVLGPGGQPVQGKLQVNLDVHWGHMRDLQILRIIGAEVRTDDLMKLTELKDLRVVHFSGTLPANALSVTHFVRLAHQLGLKRPGVHFQMKIDDES